MVARIEQIRQVVYQVYCEEEHKSLGVFQSTSEAIPVRDAHNKTCELVGITTEDDDE